MHNYAFTSKYVNIEREKEAHKYSGFLSEIEDLSLKIFVCGFADPSMKLTTRKKCDAQDNSVLIKHKLYIYTGITPNKFGTV